MRPHKVILGQPPWLDIAAEDWLQIEPDLVLQRVEIVLDRHFGFGLNQLTDLDMSFSTGFVAWGPEFLNFQRLDLMSVLKKRGLKMPALVHPTAQVSSSASFQENAWIQAQAVIGPNVKIGLNAHVGIGSRLSAHSQLGKHAWLGQDVRVGVGARVENNAVLGDSVVVGDGVRIGRQACIEKAGMISVDLPDKTFRLRSSGLEATVIELRN